MRTHMRSIFIVTLLVAGSMLASAMRLAAQPMQKTVKVTLAQPVVIGDETLAPGEYTFKEVSPKTVQVFSEDKMRAEAAVITIDTEGKQPSKDTKLILYKFPGNDNFYIDKMWIQGLNTGFEFPVPDKFKDLKREREESIAGKFEEHEMKEGLK